MFNQIIIVILLSLIFENSVINCQIIDYYNTNTDLITFTFHDASSSTLNTTYIVPPGYGVNQPPLSISYGDFITFYQIKGSFIYDVIFGGIFINTECNGALVYSLSNYNSVSTGNRITSQDNTLELDVNSLQFVVYGQTNNPIIYNISSCGTPYFGFRSFFNQYTAAIHLVYSGSNGEILVDETIPPGGYYVTEIDTYEAYSFNILSTEGLGFGAVGTILYTNNNLYFNGLLLSDPPIRLHTEIGSFFNYRITLTNTGLTFMQV